MTTPAMAFRGMKGHVSHDDMRPFAARKAAYCQPPDNQRIANTPSAPAATFPFHAADFPPPRFRRSHFLINFAVMKTLIAILAAVVLACSCSRERPAGETFTTETMNKFTPVKDQGACEMSWVYAMLATIESDRLAEGDSVNLSAAYVARCVLGGQAERCYLSGGQAEITTRGVAPDLLCALAEYGAMPYDSYRSECNYNVLCRKLKILASQGVARRVGLERLRDRLAYVLDTAVNPVPRRVWMYGAEYTPQEFARSVCMPADYVAMTSYTHEPMGEAVPLYVAANRTGRRFMNVPLDTLVSRTVAALRSGRSVCWEGCTSTAGFSFERGVARLAEGDAKVTQAMRQQAFERLHVTDDHAMAIVGLARDARGQRYFICKDSRGTENPYGGLVYMSEPYFRMNTVAVVMKGF